MNDEGRSYANIDCLLENDTAVHPIFFNFFYLNVDTSKIKMKFPDTVLLPKGVRLNFA